MRILPCDIGHELALLAPMARAAGKRLLRMVIAIGLIVALGQAFDARAGGADKPVVIATISILAEFVQAVAGGTLAVESVVPIGGDPHTYEPVPSDARRLASATLVFRNGLGLERWLDRLIGDHKPARRVVTLTDGFQALKATEGVYAGEPDPHAWMDPRVAMHYVDAVERALRDKYPGNTALYRVNAQRYKAQLEGLDAEIRNMMQEVPRARRHLVTTHDAFRYFAKRYELDLVATLWGISTETEPSARQVARIVDAIRSRGVPTVFVETTVNPKLMKRIAQEARVGVGAPLYGDSLGPRGSGADTYIGMMRANARAIADGLTPSRASH